MIKVFNEGQNFSCTGFPADSHKIVPKLEVLGFSFNCWFQFYIRDLNQSWVNLISTGDQALTNENLLVSLTNHKLKLQIQVRSYLWKKIILPNISGI